MFIALKGENFNANHFAEEALDLGARYAVIDEVTNSKDSRLVLVDDSLVTLQKLAQQHRSMFDIPVLGINGTNGKTTTKELLVRVLSKRYTVLATKGNLNNHIGVPLTLLGLKPEHEFAIIEFGANAEGEIKFLCEIARPNYGLTTNIGKAHMEGFGGIEGAIRGESEQFYYHLENGGTMFINSQDKSLNHMISRFKEPILYPQEQDYLHATLSSANPHIVYTYENGQEIQTNLIGSYNFANIAGALCIGKFFNIPNKEANDAIQRYEPTNQRSQLIKRGSNTIIMDAYNANPDSMRAALLSLDHMNSSNKVAVLGDMYELGEDSIEEHEALGDLLKDMNIDIVYLCGPMTKHVKSKYPNSKQFNDKADLEIFLKGNPLSGSTILLKASRGIALETLLDVL